MYLATKKPSRSKHSTRRSKSRRPSTAFGKVTRLVMPIGGGVQMRPTEAVAPTNLLEDEDAKVQEARTAIDLSKLAPDQWWWD